MSSLGDELPKEQARARELMAQYHEIGKAGTFGAAMIESELEAADEAVMSGDVVAMLRALESLKRLK